MKIEWIIYAEVPCRLHIVALQKGTEECSFSHHPVPESALQSAYGVTALDNVAASENLHGSVGEGSRGSKARSKPNTRQWSVFMTLSVIRDMQLLGISPVLSPQGYLGSQTCLDVNPSSALISSWS